jgi:hypothetical protein
LVEELVFLRIIPDDAKISDGEDLRNFVKRRLMGMITRVGDVLKVLMLGHPIGFKVLEVRPEEGRIGEGTEFLFEGLELAREKAPHHRDTHLYWSKRSLTPFYAGALQGDFSIAVAEFDPTRASKLVANKKLWSYYGLKFVEKE